jgi:ABC-type nitrate/sulfonate/bicarbonate transport system substrate-binding protein
MPMKNRCRGALAVVGFFVLSAAAYTAPAALLPGPIIFKAGIADPGDTLLALYMARSARLYDAQGLWVDIIDMNGGSRGAEELQAGQIDVMHVGLSSVVRSATCCRSLFSRRRASRARRI